MRFLGVKLLETTEEKLQSFISKYLYVDESRITISQPQRNCYLITIYFEASHYLDIDINELISVLPGEFGRPEITYSAKHANRYRFTLCLNK